VSLAGAASEDVTVPGQLAQDIPSLRAAGVAGGDGFAYAASQDSYVPLSYDLPRNLLEAVRRETAGDAQRRDAAIAALFDIYLDQLRFARSLTDLAALRRAGAEPAYDVKTSPILAYLLADTAARPERVEDIFPGGHGDFARPRSFRDSLRAHKRLARALLPGRAVRIDAIAQGGLVSEFLEREERSTLDLNPYLLAWPDAAPARGEVRALTDALMTVYGSNVVDAASVMPEAADRAANAVRLLTETWLAQALVNLRRFERMAVARRHGAVLVGAAPKMLGRVIARHYRAHGAQVVRCAHGGERAFYDDDHWGLSELPFCDTYMTHGTGEAEAIARRLAEGRTIGATNPAPVFRGLGSRRHRAIWRASHENTARGTRTGGRPRVLVAASSFLGEGASHVPAIKPSDVHLADLQVFLMRTLRDVGCEVWFKPHPKTMIDAPELFDGAYDELVTGPFNPAAYDVDAYLFDYAGSAFFDALASARGVILVDCGVRPFDPTTFEDLAARCVILGARPDAANRFRLSPDALRDAVAQAADFDACPEAFAERYFSGEGAAA